MVLAMRVSKLTTSVWLAILAVLAFAYGPQIMLRLAGLPDWLRIMATWIQHVHHIAESDSWDPIAKALDYVRDHGGPGLYEATYYRETSQFIYPPTSLIFAQFIAWLHIVDWHDYRGVNDVAWWLIPATAAALAGLMAALARRYDYKITLFDAASICLLASLLTVGYFPIMFAVYLGQIQTWLNFLAILSMVLWVLNAKSAAGVTIGLICIIKPQLAPLLVWGLLRREWAFAMGIAGVTGTVGLISLARFGWPVHAEYLDLLQFLSHRGESYVDNQTVNGFLNRMLFLGNNLEWDGSHSQSVLDTRVYLATLGSFLLMAAIAVFYRVRHAPGPLDLALAILIFTFASPMAYRHHAGISAAIFILLFFQYRTRRMARFDWFFLGVTFIFMANVFNGFNVFASTYLNFLQSNFLFAVAALIYQVMRAARWQSNPRHNAPLQTACVVP